MIFNTEYINAIIEIHSIQAAYLNGRELPPVAKRLIEIGKEKGVEIENEEATWFIDPPHQFGGQHQYQFGNKHLDFKQLGDWCKSRLGQTIVCENTKADWLPFMPVKKIQGAANSFTTEAIWSNHKTNYDNVQVSLFEGM